LGKHQSSSLAQKLIDAGIPNVWGWDTRCAGKAAQVLAVNFFQLCAVWDVGRGTKLNLQTQKKNVKDDNFITKNRSATVPV
jgi:hypothetical protein